VALFLKVLSGWNLSSSNSRSRYRPRFLDNPDVRDANLNWFEQLQIADYLMLVEGGLAAGGSAQNAQFWTRSADQKIILWQARGGVRGVQDSNQ
jgi:hypothetical protein